MTKARADFLKECLNEVGSMPLDEFNVRFCVRCQSGECSRAGGNNTSFSHRVANWQSTMFDNVPRADENDPSFAHIRSKRFLPIQGQPAIVVPSAFRAPAEPTDPTMETPLIIRPTAPPVAKPPPFQGQVPANTPFQQGTVLPGAPAAPSTPEGGTLESGGSFTFGGSDG